MGRKKKNVEVEDIELEIEALDDEEVNEMILSAFSDDEEEQEEIEKPKKRGRKKSKKKPVEDVFMIKKDSSMLNGVVIREENDLILLDDPEFEQKGHSFKDLASYNAFFRKLYVGKYCTDEQLAMFEEYLSKNTRENKFKKSYEVLKTKPIKKIENVVIGDVIKENKVKDNKVVVEKDRNKENKVKKTRSKK